LSIRADCYLILISNSGYLLIFLVVSFTSISSFAQDADIDSTLNEINRITGEKLLGLKKVRLHIFSMPKEFLEKNLSESQFQTEAEIRLRRVGIYDEKASPNIQIFIVEKESNNYSTSFRLEVELRESALLKRTNTYVYITTWKWEHSATVEKNRLQNSIREKVGEGIDQFIKDYKTDNAIIAKKNTPAKTDESERDSKTTTKQGDSPFTAVYVGGNKPPEVEVFNATDRTMYLDLGQGKMTAYTILSGASQAMTLTEGNYNYEASAPRAKNLEGQKLFQRGYVYYWKFTIVTTRSTTLGIPIRRKRRKP